MRSLRFTTYSHRLALILILVVLTGIVSWQAYQIRQLKDSMYYSLSEIMTLKQESLKQAASFKPGLDDQTLQKLQDVSSDVFSVQFLNRQYQDLLHNHIVLDTHYSHGKIAASAFKERLKDIERNRKIALENKLMNEANEILKSTNKRSANLQPSK